jgi:hypothetical protein
MERFPSGYIALGPPGEVVINRHVVIPLQNIGVTNVSQTVGKALRHPRMFKDVGSTSPHGPGINNSTDKKSFFLDITHVTAVCIPVQHTFGGSDFFFFTHSSPNLLD